MRRFDLDVETSSRIRGALLGRIAEDSEKIAFWRNTDPNSDFLTFWQNELAGDQQALAAFDAEKEKERFADIDTDAIGAKAEEVR